MEKKKIIVFLLTGALILAVAGLAVGLYRGSDWKAPALTLVDDYEADYGQPVYMYQLIEQADDRSHFTITMVGEGQIDEEEKTITFSGVGDYPVELTAVDAHGNRTVETVTVHVVDRVAPVITAEDLVVYVGEEADYKANMTAKDEVDGDLTEAVAVNSSKVDLETPGRYEVIYSVEDRSGNSASYTCSVTVQQQPAQSITLSREEVYLAGNEYEQLKVSVLPEGWEGTVNWSSSDPEVATVTGGLVVWTGSGSCTITATADDVSAECKFYCEGPVASDLWLSTHTITLKRGETGTLTTTVWPSNWAGAVTWESSDPTVATVDGGVVTWVGPGSCTITAVAEGQSDSCEVTCEGLTIEDFLNGFFGTGTNNVDGQQGETDGDGGGYHGSHKGNHD